MIWFQKFVLHYHCLERYNLDALPHKKPFTFRLCNHLKLNVPGILQYDGEVYANGNNDACGNDGYGKDGNSSSGSGRYQIPHHVLNSNRSPQHSERNGVHDSSQNYSTVSLVTFITNKRYFENHWIVWSI